MTEFPGYNELSKVQLDTDTPGIEYRRVEKEGENTEVFFLKSLLSTGYSREFLNQYFALAESIKGKTITSYANVIDVNREKLFIVTEWVANKTAREIPARRLDEFLADRGKLSPAEAWVIMMQIATCARDFERMDGVEGHNDLAPRNIVVEDEEELKIRVVDLGAPQETDGDIQAIGKLYYYLLTNDEDIFEKSEDDLKKDEEDMIANLGKLSHKKRIVKFLADTGVLRGDEKCKADCYEKMECVIQGLREIPSTKPDPPFYSYCLFWAIAFAMLPLLVLLIFLINGFAWGGLTFDEVVNPVVGAAGVNQTSTPTPTHTPVPPTPTHTPVPPTPTHTPVPPTPTHTPVTPTFTHTPVTPTLTPECINSMELIEHLSLEENKELEYYLASPGETIMKGWSVKNTGTCYWDTSYYVSLYSRRPMEGKDTAIEDQVAPGDTYQIWLPLVAPPEPKTSTGVWKIKTDGELFGDKLWVLVEVQLLPLPTPTDDPIPTSVPPTPIPLPPNENRIPVDCIPNNSNNTFYFENPSNFGHFNPKQENIEVYVAKYQYYTIRYEVITKMPETKKLQDWNTVWKCKKDDKNGGIRCQKEINIIASTEVVMSSEWLLFPENDYYLILEVERQKKNNEGEYVAETEIACTYVYVPN